MAPKAGPGVTDSAGMTHRLSWRVEDREDGPRILHLQGDYCEAPLAPAEAEFVSLTVEARRPVVLNMSEVAAVDGYGLQVLRKVGRALHTRPGRLMIAAPSPAATVALRRAHYQTLIPMFNSVDEALSCAADA